MAKTNTYYSAFFPPAEQVGRKGSTTALIQTSTIKELSSNLTEIQKGFTDVQKLVDQAAYDIASLVDDDQISVLEKTTILGPRNDQLENSFTTLRNAAISAGAPLDGYRIAAENSRTAWILYTSGLRPPWLDASQPTPVTRADFKAKFNDYVYTLDNLAGALRAYAATTATWNNVTGAGKPEDGATKGAPAGTNVAGQEAADVIKSLQININSILSQSLRQDQVIQIQDARTLIDGQPVGTVIKQFQNEQQGINSATAANFSLIGAKNSNGTGWVLRGDTVYVGGTSLAAQFTGINGQLNSIAPTVEQLGKTTSVLSQSVAETSAKVGKVDARVTSLNEAFATPEGGYAKAVLQVDVNGVIAGWSAISDGKQGVVAILANKFQIVNPINAGSVTPFSVSNGVVYATNFEVDRITYGSLVDKFAGANNMITPNGGFQKFPGGVIYQWGRVRQNITNEVSFNVSFPTQFPNACTCVMATPYINGPNIYADLWIQNTGSPSQYGATFFSQGANKDDTHLDGFDWVAFGY